ncbi:MAG: hypothetical protein OXC41_07910 [Gammaproteobacteria bacterium]|nr:hypothetical protein [Gammaproteobacteria bacterium]
MSDAIDQYTPERWSKAKAVLSGDSDEGISFKTAARMAGVSVGVLKAWIARSRERNPEDSPEFHEIAEFYDTVDVLQAETMEDELWKLAKKGKPKKTFYMGECIATTYEKDPSLMMKLLRVRDERYQDKSPTGLTVNMDASEIYRRLIAGKRLAEAEQEALEAEQDESGVFKVNK